MNEGSSSSSANGKCAFYSAELLRSMLAHAESLEESPEEDELET
jgi:hypothetical protein